MGWTSLYKPEGQSMRDFFTHEFRSANHEIVDIASLLGATYIAMKYADGHIGAVIVLTRHSPKEDYNFSFKTMDESMGPYETNCPDRILRLLSPTTDRYALQWRERCYEAIKRRSNVAKVGDTIQFAESITFTDGHTDNTFKVMGDGRRTYFVASNHKMYRITNWKQKDYTLIA